MKKNFKIIQISGISGLLLVGFIAFCLFCGFIGFPIWFISQSWNYLVADILGGPTMSLVQGTLFWSIICLSAYICAKDTLSIKIQADDEMMQDPEIMKMLSEIKAEEEQQQEEKVEK